MLCSYTYFTKCSCVLYCAVHCLGCIAFPCFVALRFLALRCNKYVTVRYWMSSEVTLPCDTVRDLMSSEVMLPSDTCYGSLCRGVIWYTTIRSGMVCVFVNNGAVCCGIIGGFTVRYRTLWHGSLLDSIVRHGVIYSMHSRVVRYARVRHGTSRRGTLPLRYTTAHAGSVRYGTPRHKLLRYATVRHGTSRYGRVWYTEVLGTPQYSMM